MIKKLLIIGVLLVLIVGLPLTLFILKNQTQPASNAAQATQFSFSVPSGTINVGQSFDVGIVVNPQSQNQVSFVKVTFTYDGNKLDKNGTTPMTVDTSKYTILDNPSVTCNDSNVCQVTVTISVGNNTANIIKTNTTVATMHFTAKAATDEGSPTQLAFVSGQNQALSTVSTDQGAENVFQQGTPASITIGGTASGGGPTDTPAPTSADTGTSTDVTPTTAPGAGTSDTGTAVSCTSLTGDPTSGASPLTVNFTTVGTSATDTIAKVTFNYGDGLVDDVSNGSGIGTGSINVQLTHTYQQDGTYTATATLTTTGGSVSSPTSCSQTITVGAVAQANTPTPAASGGTGLPPTGPGTTLMTIGAFGAALTILGALIAIF